MSVWHPGPIPDTGSTTSKHTHRLVSNKDESCCESTEATLNLHENEESDAGLDQQLDDAAQALHVMPIIAMLPIFWCLYDQQSSVWTLQATRMELNGLQPEQLNVVNPLEIMVLVPLFDRCIYPALEVRGVDLRPLRRMSWGMILAAVSFVVSAVVEHVMQQREASGGPKVNVWWQLPQITILS